MYRILFQNDDIVAIDKPAGYHVHPPENSEILVPRSRVILYGLRKQIQKKLYPVHRLDVATSGVLLYALSSEQARDLNAELREGSAKKTYLTVVRGFVQPHGEITLPLELDSTKDLVPAHTEYQTLARIEFDVAVGKKFKTARYSLLEVHPHTGRYHQIRRHFNRISSPVVGDTDHGDSHHNRFFREQLDIQGLCLRAWELKTANHQICAGTNTKWNSIFNLFTGQLKNSPKILQLDINSELNKYQK